MIDKDVVNGANLVPAFHAAMELAVVQGQIAFGTFERRPVIFWMPRGVRPFIATRGTNL